MGSFAKAAYGFSEIAKHSPKARSELVPKIKKIAEREENNGVRNVCLKALWQIKKRREIDAHRLKFLPRRRS
jgi:hypothetical protein